jgi:hypothetical protein
MNINTDNNNESRNHQSVGGNLRNNNSDVNINKNKQ